MTKRKLKELLDDYEAMISRRYNYTYITKEERMIQIEEEIWKAIKK